MTQQEKIQKILRLLEESVIKEDLYVEPKQQTRNLTPQIEKLVHDFVQEEVGVAGEDEFGDGHFSVRYKGG